MRKDLISIMDVLSSNAQGLSLAQIAAKTGVPKTSAKHILDTAKANNIDWATFCQMTPERQQEIFLPKRRTQMNYVEPDWETVYLQHERPRRRIALRILWEQYCQSVAEAQRRLVTRVSAKLMSVIRTICLSACEMSACHSNGSRVTLQ